MVCECWPLAGRRPRHCISRKFVHNEFSQFLRTTTEAKGCLPEMHTEFRNGTLTRFN